MFMACFCFMAMFIAFKSDLHAEDLSGSIEKIAYIDKDNNLVLRFAPFSTGGYTAKAEGNGGSTEVAVPAGQTTAAVGIQGIYAAGQVYTLTLTANDNQKFIKVTYYTGAGIRDVKASQSNETLNVNWNVDESNAKNDYNSIKIQTANQTGDLKKSMDKDFDHTAKDAAIQSPLIPTGQNIAYVVGVKDDHFGYGGEEAFEYAAKPAKVAGLALYSSANSKITAEWNVAQDATGYAVYIKKPGSSQYKLLKNTSKTSCTAKGLKKNKTYGIKVQAYSKAGTNTVYGSFSAARKIKITNAPDPVVRFAWITDRSGVKFGLKWAKVDGVNKYQVEIREKGQTSYENMGVSSMDYFSFNKAGKDLNKTYEIRVYSVKGNKRSRPSKVQRVNPASYLKEHRDEMLASKVRTIRYLNNHKCDYTTANYSNETKEAYVNYKGLTSNTKYLIWASLYTQQATVYEGYKGHWKIKKTFDIASGSWDSRTPRGTHKLFKHESKWQHHGWRTMYVTHFYKKASFHMRPKYNNGKIKDPRIGKPISAACIRCYDADAKLIYSLPLGTTAKIY